MSSQETQYYEGDLPDSLMGTISNVLHSFSTALLKVTDHPEHGEKAQLIGSGTFVSVGDIRGILTAQHVAKLLDDSCHLGMAFSARCQQKFTIDSRCLRVVEIADSEVPGESPDLAFVGLPQNTASEVSAYSSFFHLSSCRQMMLTQPLPLDRGVWFVCGTPDERTTVAQLGKLPSDLLSLRGLCGAGRASRQYVDGGYDYIEINVEYANNQNIPISFGGVSGGGLWQVTIRQASAALEPVRYFLCGVPFYQSELNNNRRFIRCYGRESTYRIAFDHVRRAYALP
jgi:hypothetical protein